VTDYLDSEIHTIADGAMGRFLKMRKWLVLTGTSLLLIHFGWLDIRSLASSFIRLNLPSASHAHWALTVAGLLQAGTLVFVLLQLLELYRQELLRRLGRAINDKLFPIRELRREFAVAKAYRADSFQKNESMKERAIKDGEEPRDTVFFTDVQNAEGEMARLERQIALASRQARLVVLPEIAIDFMRVIPAVAFFFYALAMHGAWWGTPATISFSP